MRNARITIILLAVMGAAVEYWGRPQGGEALVSKANFQSCCHVTGSFGSVFPGAILSRQSEPILSSATRPAVAAIPTALGTPVQLSADASALVTEMCNLHLLADAADLSLTSQEWSVFAAVVLRTQAIRQACEARIATSQVIAPGHYRLEIPAYAGVGDALREKFHADLRTELGELKAAEVLAKVGDRLEGRFAGFGVSVQTLEVNASPGGALGDMEVTRTATYWNSVEGSDRLTTRREIYFPALEDPTGDGWSALLAMVKA